MLRLFEDFLRALFNSDETVSEHLLGMLQKVTITLDAKEPLQLPATLVLLKVLLQKTQSTEAQSAALVRYEEKVSTATICRNLAIAINKSWNIRKETEQNVVVALDTLATVDTEILKMHGTFAHPLSASPVAYAYSSPRM